MNGIGLSCYPSSAVRPQWLTVSITSPSFMHPGPTKCPTDQPARKPQTAGFPQFLARNKERSTVSLPVYRTAQHLFLQIEGQNLSQHLQAV